MGELGGISGKQAIKAFTRLGYTAIRQSGSHVRMKDPTGTRPYITIPLHKELAIGLLHRLLKDTNVSSRDFLSMM